MNVGLHAFFVQEKKEDLIERCAYWDYNLPPR